ncbi:DegT/DnrJ/EryC1/StrS family aminotransferase [Thermodesulfovibrionales bacterium]|nr:DegT/DnrJ/EryC1/StrS family aminotransferase [Thermodesulfovibrionales bacterium]
MKKIPMLDLRLEYEYMKEDIDSAIRTCLEHQKWILGPEVKELEDKIAEYLNVKHCIGICSGTDALVLSLRALAIKIKGEEYWDRDDLIITTPFTFTATGDAILRAGATPLFVDIDPNTYNIDPARIKEYLTQNSQLRTHNSTHVVGVVPVHLYGLSCPMDKIMAIARKYNLFVLEDVAQAFGGIYKGRKLGSIGTAGAFSFFPAKNLGGFGDGGMVSTDDDELAELIRMLLKHGGKDKYNVEYIGYNARLDTLQAAIVLAKFKYIDEFNERRRKVAEIYSKELAGIDGLVLPIISAFHVYHQYTIRVLRNKRDELKERLQRKGISSAIYYPLPLHKMKVFHEKCKLVSHLIEAEKAVREVLSLPVEPLLTEKEITHVCEIIKEIMTNDKAQILNKVQMTKLKW